MNGTLDVSLTKTVFSGVFSYENKANDSIFASYKNEFTFIKNSVSAQIEIGQI